MPRGSLIRAIMKTKHSPAGKAELRRSGKKHSPAARYSKETMKVVTAARRRINRISKILERVDKTLKR